MGFLVDLPKEKENDSDAYNHLIVSGTYAYQGIGLVSLYIMCFGQSFALASKSETLWVRGTNENKITGHFIILMKPHDITNMNVLGLNLKASTTTKANQATMWSRHWC